MKRQTSAQTVLWREKLRVPHEKERKGSIGLLTWIKEVRGGGVGEDPTSTRNRKLSSRNAPRGDRMERGSLRTKRAGREKSFLASGGGINPGKKKGDPTVRQIKKLAGQLGEQGKQKTPGFLLCKGWEKKAKGPTAKKKTAGKLRMVQW